MGAATRNFRLMPGAARIFPASPRKTPREHDPAINIALESRITRLEQEKKPFFQRADRLSAISLDRLVNLAQKSTVKHLSSSMY
ncbi:hypothetical protein JXA32_06245 [Candidatus Sumerlaeota bacterium]|nr:hypothetical protein [Candidatus Sumerlaeota bacterium]